MAAAGGPCPVLAVTGLRAEARIAARGGAATLAGGGDAARLAILLHERLSAGARAVISFGLAGGLAPGLRPGTIIIAEAVEDGDASWPTDPEWRARLRSALPNALTGRVLGVDRAVGEVEHKATLHAQFGALAVDMESHVSARLAVQHRVPFAALRIVADPAGRALPRAALVGMRADGTMDLGAVLRALLRRPADLPALILTGLEARSAFAALKRCRSRLGGSLGLSDTSRSAVHHGSGDAATADEHLLTVADAVRIEPS